MRRALEAAIAASGLCAIFAYGTLSQVSRGAERELIALERYRATLLGGAVGTVFEGRVTGASCRAKATPASSAFTMSATTP